MTTIPRPEHPQPQMRREKWMNLNGEWNFCIDNGDSGKDRKLYQSTELSGKIIVPFCPESTLSGIGHVDFMSSVWYQRRLMLKKELDGSRILLHFGAVDYHCSVWVNGKPAGEHLGGYSSFAFDITDLARDGENNLVVNARDDVRCGLQPRGKQSPDYFSNGCNYTRTTGIWQTVWIEYVPKDHICSVQYYPNIADNVLTIKARVQGQGFLRAEASYEGRICGSAAAKSAGGTVLVSLPLTEAHLWEPGHGRLYDLKLSFGEDCVKSYFGMREIRIDGERVLINGRSVFQRLVLDQGYYPDGIYTAPSQEEMVRDIEISLAAGYNGARLHQKIFEPRYLYHCDRLGYLVWEEHGCWGLDYSSPRALAAFLPEWMEALERDFNHPAIIGWCPFNETWDFEGRKQDESLLKVVYQATKLFDSTRPCIDTSGSYHVITDIYDLHDYEQDPDELARHYASFKEGGELRDTHPQRQTPVKGIPVFISEYGGIRWDTGSAKERDWGYGERPKTREEFIERYQRLTEVILDNPRMSGFCYTQLYDVEQEVNGLYTYDRKPKFDMKVFQEINSRRAAIEGIISDN